MTKIKAWAKALVEGLDRFAGQEARINRATEGIAPTHCHCSRGWLSGLFEALLGCEVEVELLSSILGGAPLCEFAIRALPR